jgi:hypothetical protein
MKSKNIDTFKQIGDYTKHYEQYTKDEKTVSTTTLHSDVKQHIVKGIQGKKPSFNETIRFIAIANMLQEKLKKIDLANQEFASRAEKER